MWHRDSQIGGYILTFLLSGYLGGFGDRLAGNATKSSDVSADKRPPPVVSAN